MKTQPMAHQTAGINLLNINPEYYALGCEMGTGKTWMMLADIEQKANQGYINAVLIVAPKGVHTNWIKREIPQHLETPVKCEYYLSGMGKTHAARVKSLLAAHNGDTRLPILSINIDAFNTKAGYDTAKAFLMRHRAMMIIDESTVIKNPDSSRTKKILSLYHYAQSRRILSGLMTPNSPLDIFSQFQFLQPGILGTNSYRIFVARYAKLLPHDHPTIKAIKSNRRGAFSEPQIVATDLLGRKIWKNLDDLSARMAPYTYRVTKEQCLGLPDKIYTNHYFSLTPQQRRDYNELNNNLLLEFEDGETLRVNALTKITKLQQITSGYVNIDSVPTYLGYETNPRIHALMEALENVSGSFIIWATYAEEIRQIKLVLAKLGISFVEYHGGIKDKERETAIDLFQSKNVRCFLGNPKAGGIGITLTAAETVIYFSNSYDLEERKQSEDRAHRKGTTKNVVYIDLIADNTIDEKIAIALQNKIDVADYILQNLNR